jgi:hypothetical protein
MVLGATPGSAIPSQLDVRVAHSARVYDYWLGGKDNFAADREAAEQVIAVRPSIRAEVRANREFLGRAVRYLAGEVGIRQFLDIGTGLPSANNTHEVAQAIAPQCRIVYVDNDPIVLAHARALLTSAPEGATAYLDADARDPELILRKAAQALDFSRPVAVMLVAVLHHIPDRDNPGGIVAALMDGVCPGSHLVLSHPASDIDVEAVAEVSKRYNERVSSGQVRRSHAQVEGFFTGLELVEPGITQTVLWRPDHEMRLKAPVPMWAGVGRKP